MTDGHPVEYVRDIAAESNPVGKDDANASKAQKTKKKAKKAKKAFVPLPTLEAGEQRLPWHLVFSQRLGRHAVASQDIAAGECVLAEAAVSAVPEQQSTHQTCHTCLAPLPEGSAELQQAKGVIVDKVSGQYKRYCCQKCCDADPVRVTTGPIHAAIPQIATSTACDATLLHLILELDAHRQPNEQQQPAQDAVAHQQNDNVDNQQNAKDHAPGIVRCSLADVEALLSPWDRNTKPWREALTAGCTALRDAILKAGTYEPGTLQQLQFLAACINANAHATGHLDDTNSDTGLGMYPVLSMFNHSCSPNLAHSSKGTVQYVYAVRNIKKGEQLCVHYTNLHEPRRVRQELLLQARFFSCACERCTEPIEQSVDRFLEGISCSTARCQEVLLKHKQDGGADVWKCVGCGITADASNVEGTGPMDVEQQADMLYAQAAIALQQQGSAAARPAFEELLQQCQGASKLHPMHVRVIDSYMPLANGCRRTGDVVGAIKHVTAVVTAMEFYYPFPCIEVTNLYKHLVELHLDWADGAASQKLAARPKKLARELYRKYDALRSVCQQQICVDDDLVARLKRS